MTIRYVGPGGDNGNSGLSWADRKLTLNGVEDTPIGPGDTIYVGPGVYREEFYTDVDGLSGDRITYIADVAGVHTDGVGGVIRISGSNDDSAFPNTRSRCLRIRHDYRTFKGFYFGEIVGGINNFLVWLEDASNCIVEYCIFGSSATNSVTSCSAMNMDLNASGVLDNVLRNCIFFHGYDYPIFIIGGTDRQTDVIIENCLTQGNQDINIYVVNAYGNIIRGCTIMNGDDGVYVVGAISGQVYVYDCDFRQFEDPLYEGTVDTLTADYNFINGCDTPSVSEGADTVTSYLPLKGPLLKSGYKFPFDIFDLSSYNDNIYMSDTSALAKDLFGLDRPASGKRSRGCIQFKGFYRDESEYRSAPSSIKMDDASRSIISFPVNADAKIRVIAYVKREADYAGTAPQLVVKLPGREAITVTDSGGTGTYNKLETIVIPTSSERWMQVELVSNNTATSGNYRTWFDDFTLRGRASVVPTMKWITNEIPMFCFSLKDVVDPWITPTIPIPNNAPFGFSSQMPTFFKP